MKEKNFAPLRKFLKDNKLHYDLTELHEANINVSEKNGFYIYNYGNAVLVPRDDPNIRLCRGLVLDKNGYLFNMPFNRFFNWHETECDEVDIENAEILEKLDGSLISVWHDGDGWEVTTRGSFYPNDNAHNFKETFIRLFNNFNKLQPGVSYMFEMMSRDNRIVTKYDEEFLVLIGARHLSTMEEYHQGQLDEMAVVLEVGIPKRFKATNINECRELFESMNDDEEGLVVIDRDMNRFKLKQESYLKMAKIISMKNQDVLDYILGRTDLDPDFTDMPELKEKMAEVKKVYDEVRRYTHNIYEKIQHIVNQKEFASHALNHNISSLLFALRKGTEFDKINIRWSRLEEYHNTMVVPTINKIIILRGVPGCGKSTWIKENNLEIYTICPDTIRLMYAAPSPYISQEYNSKVWGIFQQILRERMMNGSFTVIDATHASNKTLKEYKKLQGLCGYDLEIKTFDISLKEALERNTNREEYKKVPEEVIIRMHEQLEEKTL